MQQKGIKPNNHSYSSIINACGKGGQLQKALQLFEQMKRQGLVPDVQTVGAVLDACDRAGDWKTALAILKQAESCKHIRLETQQYNSVIGALTRGGRI